MPTKKTPTTRAPRQRKTPAQRAQETYDVSLRKVERLAKNVMQLSADLAAAQAELDDEKARRDYLAAHPDLQQPATTKDA